MSVLGSSAVSRRDGDQAAELAGRKAIGQLDELVDRLLLSGIGLDPWTFDACLRVRRRSSRVPWQPAARSRSARPRLTWMIAIRQGSSCRSCPSCGNDHCALAAWSVSARIKARRSASGSGMMTSSIDAVADGAIDKARQV